jgi:hypothetical protein
MIDSENALINLLKERIDLLNYTSLDENEYNQTYFEHSGLPNIDIQWLIERYEAGHGASER